MYLVTGATGNVGRKVVELLLQDRKRVRVFVRSADKAGQWNGSVEVAIGEFGKPDTFADAIKDVGAVFLMNGGPETEPFRKLIDAAKAQSKPKIVFLSSTLAGTPELEIGKWHKEKEDAIRESGLKGAFVSPGAFMSNSRQWIGTIRTEGVVFNPTGNVKYAPIAPEDIAAVAVKALTGSENSEKIFELSGGELLSVPDQVNILSNVLGKSLRCVDVPVEAAVQGLIRSGLPERVAVAVAQSFGAVRAGRGGKVLDTVQKVTGRKPKTFEAWAREHAAQFA